MARLLGVVALVALVLVQFAAARPTPAGAQRLPAAGAATCQVTYVVAEQWSDGFTADVTIRNDGPPLSGWTLAWEFPSGQRVVQAWNATAAQTGASVQATNVSWNGSLPSGAGVTFGFSAGHGGTNTAPASFTLNGAPCNVGGGPTSTPSPTPRATGSPTPSPTRTPTASPPATMRLTATATPGGPPALDCRERPAVLVAVEPAGTGQLLATVTAQRTAALPGNAIGALRFDLGEDVARLQFRTTVTRTTTAAAIVFEPPPGSTQVAFVVQSSPGVARTVSLVVVDACGDWPTLVGGGPNAYPSATPAPPTPTLAPRTPTPSPTASPILATATLPPAGAPGRAIVAVQQVWDVGGGLYYDVLWNLYSGPAATSWQLLEDGRVLYAAALPAGPTPQGSSYRVQTHTYGAYTYQVVLANAAGSVASDAVVYAVGGASKIAVDPLDVGAQATQATVGQGTTDLPLRLLGRPNASFTVATNNRAVVTPQLVGGATLRLQAARAGRAALRITETTTGEVRYLGVRVRTASGQLPGLPEYVGVGSVSEDSDADLGFWRAFADDATGHRVDVRYVYVNGGPFNGWRTWTAREGDRVVRFIRESKKLGMIPYFVYYNIPDGGESYFIDRQHIEDATYMAAYYRDLKFFLDLVRQEAGDELVGIVLEPDFIGYLMQNSGGSQPVPPTQLLARTSAAYSSGVLRAGVDPAFPDTVAGLVQSINYLMGQTAPNAVFGWQFNLWASPGVTTGIPANGLMHLTDTRGIASGRAAIADEARAIASYYLSAGITSHGASFVSIDKYGLDAGISHPEAPAESTWFWHADHWNNYLLFAQTLRAAAGLPVVLWQIPVGHVNASLSPNPYPGTGGVFPSLDNTSTHYEDSAPTFFLGDTFRPGSAARLAHFATNQGGDPKVQVSGDVVTWGAHMAEAKASGVVLVLFGAGVGDSTDGVGAPPTDSYWWITQVQRYLANPVPLP